MKNLTYVPGSYSQEKQIHCLSSIANAAFGLSLPSLSELQTYVTNVTDQTLADGDIQGYIGNDWTPVWGTIVASQNPNAASVVVDNSMGLFYSAGQNLLVLAIAGTNMNSTYDWLQEDFNVNTTVSWQSVVEGAGITIPSQFASAAISEGTYNGLQELLSMTDGSQTMLSALSSYLSQNNISGATLAVAGHSLGGALSPTMALYLYNLQQSSTSNWNSNAAVTTIQAWPTAGPTPGESVFAAYYASLVGDNFTYTSKYNTMDVVPQAWQMSDMQTVPGIYDSNISNPTADPVIGPLVLAAMLKTLSKNNDGTYSPIQYTQISPSSSPRIPLKGSFSSLTNIGASTLINGYIGDLNMLSTNPLKNFSSELVSVAKFLAQLAYQHTTAYSGGQFINWDGLLNIGPFTARYNTIKKDVSPTGQTTEELHNQGVAYVLNKYIKIVTPQQIKQAQQIANAS